MSRIIAICGAKRSGKDILSKYIVSKYNYKKISFAEPLKNAVKALFNFNDIQKAFELVAEYSDNVLKCMINFD